MIWVLIHCDTIPIKGAEFQYYIAIHCNTYRHQSDTTLEACQRFKRLGIYHNHFDTIAEVSKYSSQLVISKISIKTLLPSTLFHIFWHFKNFYYVFRLIFLKLYQYNRGGEKGMVIENFLLEFSIKLFMVQFDSMHIVNLSMSC